MANIHSYLRPFLANIDSHPIMHRLQNLELGKLIMTMLATVAAQGLLFSPNFRDAHQPHSFLVLGFMTGCAVIWNGILFEIMYLQLVGITLVLCLLCFLIGGSFLPTAAFFWACLPGALFLVPLIYLLLLEPQPAAVAVGGDDA